MGFNCASDLTPRRKERPKRAFILYHHIQIQPRSIAIGGKLFAEEMKEVPQIGSWLEMFLYEASVHGSNAMVAQYLDTIRTAPLQDLSHSDFTLHELVGEVAALGKLKDALDIKVSQQAVHQLRKSPKCGFGFTLLARRHHKVLLALFFRLDSNSDWLA